MSQNSLSKQSLLHKLTRRHGRTSDTTPTRRDWRMIIVLPVWVAVSFFAGSFLALGVFAVLSWLGVDTAAYGSPATVATLNAILVYVFALAICMGVPYWIRHSKTTREDLGLTRLMTWADIGLAPLGMIVYLLLYTGLYTLAVAVLPFFEPNQAQDVGFSNITNQQGYILAFITLVGLAPIIEEVFFRGYMYGKLRRFVPMWVAILVTSGVFASFHGQWNVAIDTFALSIVLCGLREISGSIWAGVLLHMLKNAIAFYMIYVMPMLGIGMGG